jgi:TolB protein
VSTRFASSAGGVLKTNSGHQLQVPSGAVPKAADGSDGALSFGIETEVKPPAPLPAGYRSLGGVTTFEPQRWVFGEPVAMVFPKSIPPGDVGHTHLLRYDETRGSWLRNPFGTATSGLSAVGWELGTMTLGVSSGAALAQGGSPGADGAFRFSETRSPDGIGKAFYYLTIITYTLKYPEQEIYLDDHPEACRGIPWYKCWRWRTPAGPTADSPDCGMRDGPLPSCVGFLPQGQYTFCVSALKAPLFLAHPPKWTYSLPIVVNLDAPVHCDQLDCQSIVNVTLPQGGTWSGTAEQCPSPQPGFAGTSKIAFISRRDGNAELYIMNADGTGVARLTQTAADEDWPAWSPDGTRLAYASGGDIWLIKFDGQGARQLTAGPEVDSRPTWREDGRLIAFQRGSNEIRTMNPEGWYQQRLTTGKHPAYSPSGGVLAFVKDNDLCTMPAAGGAVTVIRRAEGHACQNPAWSPGGTQLVYDREGSGLGIERCNADGTNHTVVRNTAWGAHPSWAPDGSRLAYEVYGSVSSAFQVHTVQLDGSDSKDLGEGRSPDWSVGSMPTPITATGKIAFSTGGDIYAMNPDGTGVTQLTLARNYEYGPKWSPDGDRILYVDGDEFRWVGAALGNDKHARLL